MLETASGSVKTPVFMPVGTQGAVKAMTSRGMKDLGAGIILGNTYHLFVRPGCEIIKKAGGLHRFMSWDRPILTDSGGYQVYSLADLRKLTDEGVVFRSHVDGTSFTFTPEKVVKIQEGFGVDIMMQLDECPPATADRKKIHEAVQRSILWARRSADAWSEDSSALFGIVQGGMFVTDDETLYQRARLFRTHAISNEKGGSFNEVDYLYDVIDIGWKYDMSELNAAFCLAQFEKLDMSIERREVIAKRYMEQLKNLPHVRLPINGGEHIFRHFIVEIDKNRDHFARELKKEGISIGLHYIPLHFMTYYKQKYSLKVFDFPTALGVYQKVMSLPIYSSLDDEEVEYICEAVTKVARAHI